ncbi:DUF4089 domain-containing protein [Hansschlegelia quercus]|uniref:DUF4089 domain-containing protein n=1 Tax=Hansschlegelia quercus TaxID=2528245 RepID=A0A4Q9GTV2_9HYPH|nr:DUF4089 domain-containing protein [Hansschlegelia quercus]TBN55257.1 DUF4089 domain-containing protein [Hansschlegelia quercus]
MNLLSDETLEAHLDAATAALGLSVAPDWRPSVLAHLKATLQAGRLVADFPLDDELDPASVFRP